jgi:hypothetical protein
MVNKGRHLCLVNTDEKEELLLLNYLLVLIRRTCIFKFFFEKRLLYKFTR